MGSNNLNACCITDNISKMPCYTNPGAKFNDIGWQMIVMKDGSVIDVLFKDDEIVNEHSDIVKEIEKVFDKRFILGSINGEACLVHSVTKN